MEFRILKKRLDIGRQFDDFLDKVSEAGLLFKTGVDAYLSDNIESFEKKIENIIETEHDGDGLRRKLEETLYVQTLIPESRGDVLELLENMDALLDRFKGALWKFNIERPQLIKELNEDFRELTNCVVEAVEAIVLSSRAYFKDISSVADHIHKVPYWETQSDKIASKIQQTIFRQEDLPLSYKMQLRDFIKHIDKIADRAEDVSDKLRIYVIKRSL
jgi:predicted phosphate transport protein (TIGR00153 family)